MLMWSGSDAKGRRSTSGYLFQFGKGLITRSSKWQPARHWSRLWKGFSFPLRNNPVCQLGSIWSINWMNNNSSFSLLMSVLKPWQTSQNKTPSKPGKEGTKRDEPSLSQKSKTQNGSLSGKRTNHVPEILLTDICWFSIAAYDKSRAFVPWCHLTR